MVYRNPANTDGKRPCVPLDSIMTDGISESPAAQTLCFE